MAVEPKENWGKMVHRVRKGDSLYRLALRYYGDARYWRLILQHNYAVLEANPNRLQPGQLLYLPVSCKTDSAEPLSPRHRPDYYVVGPGDTLAGIAGRLLGDSQKYGQIVSVNKHKLTDGDKIRPGCLLTIPQE